MTQMTLNEYQEIAKSTAIFDQGAETLVKEGFAQDQQFMLEIFYLAMKMNGEAGEIGEEVAKCLRDNNGQFDGPRMERIIKECGDLLWYIAVMMSWFGVTLNEVAERNAAKLKSRQERGKLHGDGSDR